MIKCSLANHTSTWLKTQRTVAIAAATMPRVMGKILDKEAEFYRRKIVEGLKNQAPGGKNFTPKMNPWTEATRRVMGFGGTKLLIERGDLLRSIATWRSGKSVGVGVPPGAVNSEGRSLVKIARVQEYGQANILIPISTRMLRYLAMIARRSGKQLPEKTKRRKRGFIRVDIPARPFIAPVLEKYGWTTAGGNIREATRVRHQEYLVEMAKTLFW